MKKIEDLDREILNATSKIKELREYRVSRQWEIIRGQREHLDWHELKKIKKQERSFKKKRQKLQRKREFELRLAAIS